MISDLGGKKMKTNIILDGSTYITMSKSKILKDIIAFDTILSVTDLSLLDNYEIILPKEIFNQEKKYSFKNSMNKLNRKLSLNNPLRIWTSHYDIESYLLFLYLCNYLKDKKCNISVVYSDEYNIDCYSPSCMNVEELETLKKLEHLLTEDEINNYAQKWLQIKNNPNDMRILANSNVKCISFDYFDEDIIKKIKEVGTIKISRLTVLLMVDYHLSDTIIFYLIKRLINIKKIKILKENKENFFISTITC